MCRGSTHKLMTLFHTRGSRTLGPPVEVQDGSCSAVTMGQLHTPSDLCTTITSTRLSKTPPAFGNPFREQTVSSNITLFSSLSVTTPLPTSLLSFRREGRRVQEGYRSSTDPSRVRLPHRDHPYSRRPDRSLVSIPLPQSPLTLFLVFGV